MAAPPAAIAADGSSEIITTARRVGKTVAPPPAGDAVDKAAAPAISRGRGGLRPQAGLLTAGEHDDLLNPELYAAYVRRSNLAQQIPDLPRLDSEAVLTVAVKDNAGRPVALAPVELACADGGTIALATTADGTVKFFPAMDRLGRSVRVRVPGAPWRDIALGSAGGQEVGFTVARPARPLAKLDLMLVIDTTGSMGDEIAYLQRELAAIIDGVKLRHPGVDLRLGFVFYRDLHDEYITHSIALSHDIAAGQRALAAQYADGGGDEPESMEIALGRAARADWRPDAAKTMLLVADAPPHDADIGKAWIATEHLRAARVQVVPVGASGVAQRAEYVMRAMAAATQSRYTFLTDDSGIGNPHAKPAIDCYLVTRLDQLLGRVIDDQLSGRRSEPAEQDVIRQVGDYDHGHCMIPHGYRGAQGED